MRVVDVGSLSSDTFPGRASPGQEVNLSFRVAGPLIEFLVSVGDRIEADKIVARIDPTDYQTRVDAAQSELEAVQAAATRAAADLRRIENTYREDPGATSEMALDRARQERDSTAAQARAVRATAGGARDQLGYTELRAPFGGEVVETYAENFETVLAKQPILRIVDSSSIEFVVSVPENLIGYASLVTRIEVSFDALPGVKVPARIKEVGKEATQATRTYPVTLIMEQPEGVEILSGMAGEALIEGNLPEGARQLGLSIPATALFTDDDPSLSYVWVIDASSRKLERREVEVGELSEFGVLIRSGLEPGEQIVVAGVSLLDEGQEVAPIGDAAAIEKGAGK
jgi:RND family efflux transporter MFP subunit